MKKQTLEIQAIQLCTFFNEINVMAKQSLTHIVYMYIGIVILETLWFNFVSFSLKKVML